MKKHLLLLIFMVVNYAGFAQEFEVTPNGLRDTSNPENEYLVIEAADKQASQLYQNAMRYVTELYVNPDEAIKGRIENEYLKFDTYVPQFTRVNNSGAKITVSMRYTTELRFKDGKVRLEITNIEITSDNSRYRVEFSGSIWTGYPIYNKDHELRLPETKSDIEQYFNNKVEELSGYLNETNTQEDDW